jgi:hypothetical protein
MRICSTLDGFLAEFGSGSLLYRVSTLDFEISRGMFEPDKLASEVDSSGLGFAEDVQFGDSLMDSA